jgi:hypothetical protein
VAKRRSRVLVVTYTATALWNVSGAAQHVSLCALHDTSENRVGYADVYHGLHEGTCSLCPNKKE